MTIDELRALCLSLPETHEKETWGDAEHAGDVTFRVRDKIYVITGQDGGGASIRTRPGPAGRPDRRLPGGRLAARRTSGGSGGSSVRLDALDPTIVRDVIVGAWRRTAPKAGRRVRRRSGRADRGRAMTTADGGRPARTTPPARAGSRRPSPAPATTVAPPSSRTSSRATPTPRRACAIALAAADAGADILEVGLPYSDPLADGATLQRASGVALRAGATLEGSLRLIERIGAARPDLPLVPMGYANQVIGGGDGAAVARATRGCRRGRAHRRRPDARRGRAVRGRRRATSGWRSSTSWPRPRPPARRAAIAARSGGFLYCVSLVGVTGARTSLPSSVGRLVRDVKAVSPVPVAVGFGVSKPAHVRAIAKAGADGVIVASALVDALGADGRDIDGLAAS